MCFILLILVGRLLDVVSPVSLYILIKGNGSWSIIRCNYCLAHLIKIIHVLIKLQKGTLRTVCYLINAGQDFLKKIEKSLQRRPYCKYKENWNGSKSSFSRTSSSCAAIFPAMLVYHSVKGTFLSRKVIWHSWCRGSRVRAKLRELNILWNHCVC